MAIKAVVKAVEQGRISRQRIDDSVMRVFAAKIRVGAIKKKMIDLDEISDVLDDPEAEDHAQQVADRAVTLLHGSLPPAAPNCAVVMVERRLSQYGQRMATEIHRRAPGARVAFVDPSMPLAAISDAAGDTSSCSAFTVAIFLTGGTLAPDLAAFVQKLNAPVLAAIGSPYVLASFPNASAALATFSTVPTSEVAIVKALFGEIPVTGHTPVTVPGLAQYGDGIQAAAAKH
jgi:beta-N-acetylhexosaminidase